MTEKSFHNSQMTSVTIKIKKLDDPIKTKIKQNNTKDLK